MNLPSDFFRIILKDSAYPGLTNSFPETRIIVTNKDSFQSPLSFLVCQLHLLIGISVVLNLRYSRARS